MTVTRWGSLPTPVHTSDNAGRSQIRDEQAQCPNHLYPIKALNFSPTHVLQTKPLREGPTNNLPHLITNPNILSINNKPKSYCGPTFCLLSVTYTFFFTSTIHPKGENLPTFSPNKERPGSVASPGKSHGAFHKVSPYDLKVIHGRVIWVLRISPGKTNEWHVKVPKKKGGHHF